MERPKEWPEVPEEVSQSIEYHPEWRIDQQFWVEESDWAQGSKVKKYVDWIKENRPEGFYPSTDSNGHPHQDDPGMLFGCGRHEKDPEGLSDFLCRFFYLGPYERHTKRIPTEDSGSEDQKFKIERNEHRQYVGGEKNALKYPFSSLEEVGDYFLVPGKHITQVSPYANMYMRYGEHGKIVRCTTVSEGVIVVLVESPNAIYKNIFNE